MSSPNPVIVERALPSESEALSNFIRETILPLPYYSEAAKLAEIAKYSPTKLSAAFLEAGNIFIVARSDSIINGAIVAKWDDETIWLSWILVGLNTRLSGIGRALLHRLTKDAALAGAHKVWCDSRTSNLPAVRCLASSGFTPIATIRRHWYGEDFILWERDVEGSPLR